MTPKEALGEIFKLASTAMAETVESQRIHELLADICDIASESIGIVKTAEALEEPRKDGLDGLNRYR